MVWLELIMHPTASLVFESDPPQEDLMRRPPRKPGAGILTRADAMRPVAIGTTLFIGVIALYLLRLAEGASGADARALAMTTLMIGQVCMVLTERSPEKPVWKLGLRGNWILPVALVATPLSLLAALYVPFLADILKLAPLSTPDWALAAVVALAMTLWLEPVKAWRERRIEGHGERTRVAA
jgi:Ca2+-transporting ATPase